MPGKYLTNFYDENGNDIGSSEVGFIEKEYLIDVYPSLVNWVITPGLWLWGINSFGMLGTNDTNNRSSPVQTISYGSNWKQISMGESHSTAIKNDGTLWTWGRNEQGELGDNSTTNRSSPVQTISGGTDWKQLSTNSGTSTAIKNDGTLWLWGRNIEGQLGDNSRTNRSSPVQTVSGGTNWRESSVGKLHTAAIKTDGTLWVWGHNYFGQLGTNNRTYRSSPVQTVAGGTNWKQVSAGGYHTAAIKTDGTLWLWGRNDYGQLGTNDIVHRSSPVQTVSGGTDWKFVTTSVTNFTAAIKNDGTLWLWGDNQYGQLGTNDRTNRSSPVQTISLGNNWKTANLGSLHSAAIKTDGTLWLWGTNYQGELGQNDRVFRSSPIQVISGGTTWKSVSCNRFASSAIKEGEDF